MAAQYVILALNPKMDANEWQQELAAEGLTVSAICPSGSDALKRLNAGDVDALLADDLLPGLMALHDYAGAAKVIVLAQAQSGMEPDWRALIGADHVLPVHTALHDLIGMIDKQTYSTITNRLTDLENRALRVMAEGLTDEEIGLRLGIGGKDLQNLLNVLLLKLGAASRVDVMVLARRWHLFGG